MRLLARRELIMMKEIKLRRLNTSKRFSRITCKPATLQFFAQFISSRLGLQGQSKTYRRNSNGANVLSSLK